MTELQRKISSRFPIYYVKISTGNKPLIKSGLPMNIPLYLLVTLAAETHLNERQLRRLMSTLNKQKPPRLRFGTRRSTVSYRMSLLLPVQSADKDCHHTYCCSYREYYPKPNFIRKRHTAMEVHL